MWPGPSERGGNTAEKGAALAGRAQLVGGLGGLSAEFDVY